MDDEKLDALLNVLSHAYDEVGNDDDTFLVYLDIQKIFYYLQRRLDTDNKINEFPPYYWYFDGPVSDVVQQTVYRGEEIGYLRKESTPNGGNSFWLRTDDVIETETFSRSTVVSDADLDEAQQEIRSVVTEDYDIFSPYNEKINLVYEDTMFDFQRYCKQELLKPVEEFAENKPWHYSPEEIAGRLSLAESYLPLDKQFNDFNFLYSHYVTLGKQYLDAVSDESKLGASLFLRLTEEMWQLFCHQLRIVEHDPYYEQKIDDWNIEYDHHRETFISALKEFEAFLDEHDRFKVASEVDHVDDHRLPEKSSWGQVTTALLTDTVPDE